MTARDWMDRWIPAIIMFLVAFAVLFCVLFLTSPSPDMVNRSVAAIRNCTNDTCVLV